MNKGIRFTDEFEQDAVAQVVECGYGVSEVAKRPRDSIDRQVIAPRQRRADSTTQCPERQTHRPEFSLGSMCQMLIRISVAFTHGLQNRLVCLRKRTCDRLR